MLTFFFSLNVLSQVYSDAIGSFLRLDPERIVTAIHSHTVKAYRH